MRCGWSASAPRRLLALGLVVGEVALEPAHLGVALEREHVGGDAVEEPAVVADHDGAARERERAPSSSARSVSTSRSLVGSSSSSTLPPALQHLGQVDAVALAAGQLADLLLLVGALEVEAGDVGAAVDLAAADDEWSGRR